MLLRRSPESNRYSQHPEEYWVDPGAQLKQTPLGFLLYLAYRGIDVSCRRSKVSHFSSLRKSGCAALYLHSCTTNDRTDTVETNLLGPILDSHRLGRIAYSCL